jgi:hypothetical protein
VEVSRCASFLLSWRPGGMVHTEGLAMKPYSFDLPELLEAVTVITAVRERWRR